MLRPREIARFAVLVGLYGLILLAPWSVADRAYGSVFRAGANFLFSRFWFWSDGEARFIDLHSRHLIEDIELAAPGRLDRSFRPPPPTGTRTTLVLIMNRSQPKVFGEMRISSRLLGYWPTAWLVALVMAKPMSWSRRGRALVWGLLLVHGFLAFRLTIDLLAGGFAVPGKSYALFSPGPEAFGFLLRVRQVFVEDPTMSFAMATLIWFVTAFKLSEWRSLRPWSPETQGDDSSSGVR